MPIIDIRAHGGALGGGKIKKKFYQYLDNIILPYRTRKLIGAGSGRRIFRPPIKFKDKIYVVMTDYSNVNLYVLDKNLNIIQSLGDVSYSSYWTIYQNFGISKRFNKLIRLKSYDGTYYIAYHDIDSAGNIGTESTKYINNYGSFSSALIIDDDNDKFYFVWGNTLYCYRISTFNSSSTPLWSATLPWQPWYMELFGNILVISNSNPNYGTRVYTVSDSGITQIGQQTTLYPSGFLFDGIYLYFLDSSNVIKKYDINLNLIATSGNYISATRPLSENINKLSLPTDKLIDGKIHLLTNYSVLIIDPNTLEIENEYLLFDPVVTPNAIAGNIDFTGMLPSVYYNVDDGEMIFTHQSANYYVNGGSYYSESRYRLTVSKLKY
ncbi:hypothetical protein [Parageobacillus toebii]|jgi:hypothetical protein|uniref:hypothetical protein n=1 Tax=Parageobacillus toebii TaxID=153151 RepID=UPI001967BA88|nr:hypothetical protein [Parageobacillus toebii]QSB48760.1 hypothetical protein JTI59_17120 [Parageobacillus toebii]